MKTIGIILLVVGILMAAFTGFTLTREKKVIDAGPIEVTKEKKTPIYWSPVTGIVLAVGGVVLLLLPQRKATA